MLLETRNTRRLIGTALLALFAWGTWSAGAGRAQSGDPVEDLRNALVIQLEERDNAAALQIREQSLKERIKALVTINQLRRALVLTEWKDDPRENQRLRNIDLEARRAIADRMLNSLKRDLQPTARRDVRLAAATFVGELDTTIRSAISQNNQGLAREMTKDLARVIENDDDSRVRQAAAIAIGKINAAPAVAAKALASLLKRENRSQGEAVNEKRAAVSGALGMIQTVSKLFKTGQTQRGVLATPSEVVEVAKEVVPVAGIGALEGDPRVRQVSMDALLQSATALNQVVPDAYLRTDFPTNVDRPLMEAEQRRIRLAEQQVKEEQEMVLPLMKALANEGATLARDMEDPTDAVVRLFSRQALEMMATARQRLIRRVESVPVIKTQPRQNNLKPPQGVGVLDDVENPNFVAFLDGRKNALESDPLLAGLQPGIEVISRGLRDPHAEVRLASVQFLEMLGRELRDFPGAISVLVNNGLCDPNLFVRWASARTLVWAAPLTPDEIVPPLARRLHDTELEVRIAAAYTLGLYGRLAAAAIPELIRATDAGDAEGRAAALQTLAKVVQSPNEPAVMAMVNALKNEDARVRREAAAGLGQLGPNALLPGAGEPSQQPAVRALEAALQDRDNEVRQLASESLLAIQSPLEKE